MMKAKPLLLPLAAALALAVLTSLPYAWAFTHAPSGTHFLGFFFISDDANAYLAIIRQGIAGSWVWHNPYTTEFTDAWAVNVFWLAWGHLAAILHFSAYAAFQVARATGIFALLAAAWLFLREFLPSGHRAFAFLFLVLVPGSGVFLLFAHEPAIWGQPSYAIDFRFPEMSVFFSSFSLPHYVWSGACIALGCALVLRTAETASWKPALGAAAAWASLAFIHPQMVVFLGVVCAFALLARPAGSRGTLLALASFAVAVPYVLYAYFAASVSPEVSSWLAQGRDEFVPSPASWLLSFAPQILPGSVAIVAACRRRSRPDLLLLAWLALEIAILFAPTAWLPHTLWLQRRRFLDGLYLPLDTFAVQGLLAALAHFSAYARNLIAATYIGAGSLLVWFMLVATVLHAPAAAFLPAGEYGIFATLAAQPSGLVLSGPDIGLDIPARTSDRVWVGHYGETYNSSAKSAQICAIFRSGDTAGLVHLADAIGARYVVWTPDCGSNFNFNTSQLPASWQLIYQTSGARVWRVF